MLDRLHRHGGERDQAPEATRPRAAVGLVMAAMVLVFAASFAAGLSVATGQTSSSSPGVPPSDAWTCPASHPIKGNLTTGTGECIYHLRGGAFYSKTKPERCFATEDEARQAGCRRSKR